MKLVTFSDHNPARLGVLVERDGRQLIVDIEKAYGFKGGMIDLLNLGSLKMHKLQGVVNEWQENSCIPLENVTLLAPIPRPGKIICLGHNYFDHMGIGRTEPPQYPTYFGKFANTVIGPNHPIFIPRITSQVDYEAELAVVIGKKAQRVRQDEAYEYIAGYTIFNDLSARDFQKRTSQWMIGKNFDSFGPMGPALVTCDEIPNPHELELVLTLNGIVMQRAHTSSMIFSIPYLVASLSEVMTLEAGDVISTGTPAKTETAQQMEPFMKAGDVVSITIERIGTLTNPIAASS